MELALRHDIRVVWCIYGYGQMIPEYWAMRESLNDVMTDDANANYSEYEHRMLSIEHVVESSKYRQQADNEWWQMCFPTHYIAQEEWQRLEYIPFVYGKLQIANLKMDERLPFQFFIKNIM